MPTCEAIQAYRFDELCDTAKEKAISWLSDADSLVIEDTSDAILWYLEQSGIEVDPKSLTWDLDPNYRGLSFSGSPREERELVTRAIVETLDDRAARRLLAWIDNRLLDFDVSIRTYRGGYRSQGIVVSITTYYENPFTYRKNPKTMNYEPAQGYDFETQLEAVQDWLQSHFEDVASKALRAGEETYDWHFSEEYVSETCEANEYRFDCYGNPIHHLI